MALTRSLMKSLNVPAEAIDQIVDAHVETVDALKKQLGDATQAIEASKAVATERDTLKDQITALQTELEASKANVNSLIAERDDFKTRFEQYEAGKAENDQKIQQLNDLLSEREQWNTTKEQLTAMTAERDKAVSDFEAFKTQAETEKKNGKARSAARKALYNAGMTNEDILELTVAQLDPAKIEMNGDELKDMEAFVNAHKTAHPTFFSTTSQVGTPAMNPPSNPPPALTLADVKNMSTEEINKNWAAVQAVLAKGE